MRSDTRRSSPAVFVRVALTLTLCVLIGCWGWAKFRRRDTDNTDTKVNRSKLLPAVSDKDLARKFFTFEAVQNQMDQTVWATELLAEKYEDVFVTLWDNLRTNGDAFAAVKDFPFGELLLGEVHFLTRHDHGIEEFRLDRASKTITGEEWRTLLNRFQDEGYRIEQTEWRHPEFKPGPPPESLVYLSAHINNPAKRERLVLLSNLHVKWQIKPDSEEAPWPQLIDASDTKIIRLRGTPAFQSVLSAEVRPDEGNIFVDPLILYDLDGNGLSEIILGCRNLVFWNLGHGQLQKGVLCPQLHTLIYTCIIADFDGDGSPDFLAADRNGLLLFTGDKEYRFTKPGERVWTVDQPLQNPFVMTAGDIDGDGDLDVWLAQYKLPYVGGQMPTPYYDANDGFAAYLLVNDGHGRFRDGTKAAGLAKKRFRRTYSASLVDLDEDGHLDLVVVSDFAGVDLYHNDGHGRFTDVTQETFDETHGFGMAHTFGDYDGDGRLDLLMVGMNSYVAQRLEGLNLAPAGPLESKTMRRRMSHGNRLYLSRGDKFVQNRLSDDVARSGWSWGATSFDFDNDGDLDIYVVNGHKSRRSAKDYETQFWRHDIYAASSALDPVIDLYFRSSADKGYGAGESYGGYDKNRLFMNESGTSFLEVGYLMGVSAEEDCRNVVGDDLDGDGKVDLVLTTFEEWPQKRQGLHVLQNRWTESGNWIGARLKEKGAGCSPIGAQVTLKTPIGKQVRKIVTGDSYRSQHANTAHFGLGTLTNVSSIEVRWTNGRTKKIVNPAINQYHNINPD